MPGLSSLILLLVRRVAALAALSQAARFAYEFRMHAINGYGSIIHEFDPWFNFRATEYLVTNGWRAFFHWFDHAAWYPLGRPVATTIYPAMQVTSAAIFHALKWAGGPPWTLEDVCCYVPVWGGVAATLFTALLAYECSGQNEAAAVGAGFIMAIVPAHLQRSVGGGFDNESVAMPAMCATFAFWCRAMRRPASGGDTITASGLAATVAAAASYAYMAAAWGGYVFVANMVALHAGAMLVLGRSPKQLHRYYTLFFVLGTAGAMQVPVVGWTPLTHTEHLAPLVAAVAINAAALWRSMGRRRTQGRATPAGSEERPGVSAHAAGLALAAAAAAAVVAAVAASGALSPATVRVRALFLPHTHTGNPLVDSVAEHRPASGDAYHQFLSAAVFVAPVGAAVLCARRDGPTDAGLFLFLLGAAAYFFSSKMSRLIVLLATPASALSGVALGALYEAGFGSLLLGGGGGTRAVERLLRVGVLGGLAWGVATPHAKAFYDTCDNMARYSLSHTQLTWRDERGGLVDDYREAYRWLREHTPTDARVLSWWDYGYQISGMAKRTTLADGNTWNHEHIALVGLCLSSPEAEAHAITRHLADYVLVWKGGGSDDLAKSAHMARIGTSVFGGHCAEPDCDEFGMHADGRPSAMMQDALIYRLVAKRFDASDGYEEAHVSPRGLVRIVRVRDVSLASKAWATDPANRRCDAPGSWYCPGSYPPALAALLDPASTEPEARAYRAHFEGRKARQELRLPRPNGDGLPAGSYLASCRGCSIGGAGAATATLLRCTHCRGAGPASPSELDVASCSSVPPTVDNIQAELQCRPEPNAANIPRGRYASSCLGCSLSLGGALLTCTHCGTADGRRAAASYETARCVAPAQLDNNNGRLVCSGVPNQAGALPGGGYSNSCQGCSVGDGRLVCSHCGTSDGRQIVGLHELSSCKSGTFDNRDGVLVCV